MPASWNIGTFHHANPIYMQSKELAAAPYASFQVSHNLNLQLMQKRDRPHTTSMDEIGSGKKPSAKARIDPKHRVADEDYFRGIKERKSTLQTKKSEHTTMARTRFEENAQGLIGGNNADGDEKEEIELVGAAVHRTQNPHTIRYIDPNLDPYEAISSIQLPAKTIYLIDKVVRAKALQGPIGVDNSEVINLEQEKELKRRNQYLANLAAKKKQGAGNSDDEDDEQELDEEEMDLNDQERENLHNEKLLKRLYQAAQADIDKDQPERHNEGAERSSMGNVDKAVLEMHTKSEA